MVIYFCNGIFSTYSMLCTIFILCFYSIFIMVVIKNVMKLHFVIHLILLFFFNSLFWRVWDLLHFDKEKHFTWSIYIFIHNFENTFFLESCCKGLTWFLYIVNYIVTLGVAILLNLHNYDLLLSQ